MLTTITLVELKSLDPKVEPVIKWFKLLDFWSLRIEKRITEAKLHVPVDIETLFREKFELPLILSTRTLFETLLQKENGMSLAEDLHYNTNLAHKSRNGRPRMPWEDPETCTGRLFKLHLVRFQDDELLKPNNDFAFNTAIQYLIGLKPTPVS